MASMTPNINVRCCALPAVQIAGNGKRETVVASVFAKTVESIEVDIKAPYIWIDIRKPAVSFYLLGLSFSC